MKLLFALILAIPGGATAAPTSSPFCSAIVSPSPQVWRVAKSRQGELATFQFTGLTSLELYNAYVFSNMSEVIDLASTNSWLTWKNGVPVKTVIATTLAGAEATMQIHGLGGAPDSKVVETEIEVKAADFRKLGLPHSMGTLCEILATCSGLRNVTMRGRVRQVFTQLGPVGQMAEDWIRPLQLFANVAGVEVPIPSPVQALVQALMNVALPHTDIRGVRNFAKVIQDMGRNTATILALEQTMMPDTENSAGVGAFRVKNRNFIPGYRLNQADAIIPMIRIQGRYGVAGNELLDTHGNAPPEVTLPGGKFLVRGSRPRTLSTLSSGIGATDITLTSTRSTPSERFALIQNDDAIGIVGSGFLSITEETIHGIHGLVVTEIGRFSFRGKGLVCALTLAANFCGFGGAPFSQVFALVHNLSYHPEAIANALFDHFPQTQIPFSSFDTPPSGRGLEPFP